MTSEYLKMADYFAGEIDQDDIVILDCGYDTISHAPEDAAAHAINSHDELVAEVDRLRGELRKAQERFIDAYLHCHELQGIIDSLQ